MGLLVKLPSSGLVLDLIALRNPHAVAGLGVTEGGGKLLHPRRINKHSLSVPSHYGSHRFVPRWLCDPQTRCPACFGLLASSVEIIRKKQALTLG